jgi:hypothetical protein
LQHQRHEVGGGIFARGSAGFPRSRISDTLASITGPSVTRSTPSIIAFTNYYSRRRLNSVDKVYPHVRTGFDFFRNLHQPDPSAKKAKTGRAEFCKTMTIGLAPPTNFARNRTNAIRQASAVS